MSTVTTGISDMLLTVKAREIQRAMLAEMRGLPGQAVRHFLAAAHLELVLASDYAKAGQDNLALRSNLSAGSCFWRAGDVGRAGELFEALTRDYPQNASEIANVVADLERTYPR